MRYIVCGGRGYKDRDFVFRYLDDLWRGAGITEIIEGGANGADALAVAWARMRGVPFTTVTAHWLELGKAAGPIRNGEMLAMKPDGVIAFPGGAGTLNMIKQALAKGVPIYEAKP